MQVVLTLSTTTGYFEASYGGQGHIIKYVMIDFENTTDQRHFISGWEALKAIYEVRDSAKRFNVCQ
jgi:hypothetical protein